MCLFDKVEKFHFLLKLDQQEGSHQNQNKTKVLTIQNKIYTHMSMSSENFMLDDVEVNVFFYTPVTRNQREKIELFCSQECDNNNFQTKPTWKECETKSGNNCNYLVQISSNNNILGFA